MSEGIEKIIKRIDYLSKLDGKVFVHNGKFIGDGIGPMHNLESGSIVKETKEEALAHERFRKSKLGQGVDLRGMSEEEKSTVIADISQAYLRDLLENI